MQLFQVLIHILLVLKTCLYCLAVLYGRKRFMTENNNSFIVKTNKYSVVMNKVYAYSPRKRMWELSVNLLKSESYDKK